MIKLRIGYIPLCDAAMLLIAIDKGFCTAEGLEVEAVREVSWSNVRDKLNIGLFDAAHLLAPPSLNHGEPSEVGVRRSGRARRTSRRPCSPPRRRPPTM